MDFIFRETKDSDFLDFLAGRHCQNQIQIL
jgi:hypothetical protein